MSDLVAKLQECINPFQFGKLDLLERMDELRVHTSGTAIVIDNWFDYRPENLYGDCGELIVKAYDKISKEFPDLIIEVNWGYDNQFFNPFIGWHAFLTAQESPDGPRILIDPALQKVELFEGSGYIIEDTESNQSMEDKLASLRAPLALEDGDGTLLGIDQNTGLFYYIGMNHQQGNEDVLIVTTYRNPPPETSPEIVALMPVDKRTFPISPCPEDIRKQAPYFELAYQLEKHVASQI